MAPTRRLLIAAADTRIALAAQSHLQRTGLAAAPVVRFDEVGPLLTPHTDGLVLLVVADADDAAAAEVVVREATVQQVPVRFGVLETDAVRAARRLDHLDPYLAGRWASAHQSAELAGWAREALAPGTPFPDPATESAPDRIRRRLVCQTPSLTAMADQLTIAAAHDVTVLVEGETGTGKTFLARLIHESSARRAHRLLAVPCGALAGNLIAGEFFGHVKGAFTGADAAKVGKFAAAGEGTILLDEIDTLGLEHQANLLRVIETGEYEPVGGTETQVNKARIIAATNWNLADAVERGAFRRDLYYRLHVISFHLPALRHRPEDIGPLVRGLVAKYGTKFGKRLFAVSPEAMTALESFPWPGNIRQLENVIQQAVLTSTGHDLRLHHLAAVVSQPPADVSVATPPPVGFGGTLKQGRESIERANILRALEKAGQSRTRAAELLGVSRVTLYKKMRKYNMFARGLSPLEGFGRVGV